MKAGWISPEYHWMSWALSALQIVKLYGKIELVTDCKGKEILIDTLKLPYSNVITDLEEKMDNYPQELWSLAKVYTYSMQDEPFIHIDGDCFLWNKFNSEIDNAELVCQNLEIDLFYYREMLIKIRDHFKYIPKELSINELLQSTIYACNAGVFGGKNLDFIKFYCHSVFQFIEKNQNHLYKIDRLNFNFIYEQCLLYYLALTKEVPVTYLFKEPVSDPLYKGYIRFTDIPAVQIIHTVGGYKGVSFICDQIAKRLRQHYPAYYYSIIEICKQQNISIRNKIYYTPSFNSHMFYPNEYIKWRDSYSPLTFNQEEEAEKISEEELLDADLSNQFKRTLAFLQFIGQPFSSLDNKEYALYEIQKAVSNIHFIEESKRGKEIFEIEYNKRILQNFLLKNATNLYIKDIKACSDADYFFNISDKEIENLRVCVDDTIILLELAWEWETANNNIIEKIFESISETEPSFYLLALVPNPLRMIIEEYFLDNLDMIIVYTCKYEKYIHEIVQNVQIYFDQEEVEESPSEYKYLISDSIKRLVYNGILKCHRAKN